MFGKVKSKESTKVCATNRDDACQLIIEALNDMDDASDGTFLRSYIWGLADMAFALNVISYEERIDYKDRAHKKEQEIKSKGEPVYKKKGVYEYNGYYILKDFAREATSQACWCVKKMNAEDIIAKDLTFKDAIKAIDNSTN